MGQEEIGIAKESSATQVVYIGFPLARDYTIASVAEEVLKQ